jgi:hypothetical protein
VLADADRYQSWEVVALAIRRFLDQGAMSLMDQADDADSGPSARSRAAN